MKFDLVAYDKFDQLVLVGEIKAKLTASIGWASQLRRNILAHGLTPSAKFFLVALPDRLYLWKNAGNLPDLVEPDYIVDAQPLLDSYFARAGLTAQTISGQTFELLVVLMLNDLFLKDVASLQKQGDFKWLLESGLYDELQGGRIEQEKLAT